MHSSTLLIVMLATVLLGVANAQLGGSSRTSVSYNNTLVLGRCGDFDTIHGYTYFQVFLWSCAALCFGTVASGYYFVKKMVTELEQQGARVEGRVLDTTAATSGGEWSDSTTYYVNFGFCVPVGGTEDQYNKVEIKQTVSSDVYKSCEQGAAVQIVHMGSSPGHDATYALMQVTIDEYKKRGVYGQICGSCHNSVLFCISGFVLLIIGIAVVIGLQQTDDGNPHLLPVRHFWVSCATPLMLFALVIVAGGAIGALWQKARYTTVKSPTVGTNIGSGATKKLISAADAQAFNSGAVLQNQQALAMLQMQQQMGAITQLQGTAPGGMQQLMPGMPVAIATATATATPVAAGGGISEEIQKLANLKNQGLLSDEEFTIAKSNLLANNGAP